MTKKSQRLLLEAYPSIQRVAVHLAVTYRPTRFDADDLAQIGALAVAEALKKGIHPKGNKVGYVVVIARRAMRHTLGQYASLIVTPRTANGFQPALLVLSLDAPLFADGETTLLDLIDAGDDYAALYDCYLDSLPGEVQA